MRRYTAGPVLGLLLGVPLMVVLSHITVFFTIMAWVFGGALVLAFIKLMLEDDPKTLPPSTVAQPKPAPTIASLPRTLSGPEQDRGMGVKPTPISSGVPAQPRSNIRPSTAAGVQTSAAGAFKVDMRFALVDREGQRRYAQVIKGTFQLGKERQSCPTDLAVFARAILKEGASGRFTRADGSKHGVLGYGGAGRREAVGYYLDREIAMQLGLPSTGRL